MLVKRTNILFDEELWEKLTTLAKERKTSIGELVRTAVKEKLHEEQMLARRQVAIDAIKKIRPPISKTPIDYKALINYGRKY